MNNYLNHWYAEQMVRDEMREVDRAVKQARLLREAGLIGPSWLSRAIHSLGNWLKARREGLQAQRPTQPNVYQRESPRSA